MSATLSSGQAFRWREVGGGWEGIVRRRWVSLTARPGEITAETAAPEDEWEWLKTYLQLDVDLPAVVAEFPGDAPLSQAVRSCWGLRLLRQEPWECLASFILSSTKQIVQIQQIVHLLCQRFGDPVITPAGHPTCYSFPPPIRIAQAEEAELRGCKMGFRAPYLKATAAALANGELDLASLAADPVAEARARLLELPGVGRKIADCVLLFAYGFQDAFPVDVWVRKALQDLYFSGRRVKPKRLEQFSAKHFGRYAGYAQQYLFHWMRTQGRRRR